MYEIYERIVLLRNKYQLTDGDTAKISILLEIHEILFLNHEVFPNYCTFNIKLSEFYTVDLCYITVSIAGILNDLDIARSTHVDIIPSENRVWVKLSPIS